MLAKRGVHLVGVTGAAGSGKTKLAEALVLRGFRIYSFAAPLKTMISQLPQLEHIFSMTRTEKETVLQVYGKSPRQMMQTLGTEWGRHLIHPHIWVNIMEQKILNKVDMQISTKFVIDDLRYPNEAVWIRENGGLIVHIQRDGIIKVASHSSEEKLEITEDDLVIYNADTLEAFQANSLVVASRIQQRVDNSIARF